MSKLADLQLTTKRMETEYKAMAYAIINKEIDPATGNPYEAPKAAAMWSTVNEQFNLLLEQLDSEKAVNQKLLDQAHANVAQCNTDRNTAYTETDGVNDRDQQTTDDRTSHTDCRTSENAHIEVRNQNCSAFVEKALCDAHENDYNYFVASDDVGPNYQSVPQALLDAIEHAEDCKDSLHKEKLVSQDCDAKQRTFEMAFCMYDLTLRTTCTALDSCYSAATADLNLVNTSVAELETNQKVVYKMVQKVKCYVDAMSANFKTLTASHIKTCEDQKHDASKLDISYKPVVPKVACDLSKLSHGVPGDASWATQEYTAVHNEHHGEDYANRGQVISKIETQLDCAGHQATTL